MTQINWSLLQPTDVGNAFNQGMETGRARKREEVTQNALSGLAKGWPGSGVVTPGTPGIAADPQKDEADFNALLAPLAQIDPMMAIKIREMRNKTVDDGYDRQVSRAKVQREADGDLTKATGQAALDVLNLPPEQRSQAWDAYVDQFARRYPNAAQYKGQYSDANAKALLAQAGMIDSYQKSQEPKYLALPHDADLVNLRNPSAVAQFGAPSAATPATPQTQGSVGEFMTAGQARSMAQGTDFIGWQKRFGTPVLVNSPEEAASLPAGTIMVSPDGRRGVKR